MNIFFDVLDTLLTEDETPPPPREAFLTLGDSRHAAYLWSSGGASQDFDPTGALDLLQTMVET